MVELFQQMSSFHRAFHAEIDKLSIVQMCNVCRESYPGMNPGIHRFSRYNNMNPGKQPPVLSILTQVEEMLIARVNPILQVTHARGGQYKYSGHTISFPQDIVSIAKTLPRRIEDLDILIVRREGPPSKHYDCIVSRSRVMDALHYKIRVDKYYRDVEVDLESVICLPDQPIDVSSKLHYINSDIADSEEIDAYIDIFGTH